MNSKYSPKWVCNKCKKIEVETNVEIIKLIEGTYDTQEKDCECGGQMHSVSASEQAERDGLFWCATIEDFVMTPQCPRVNCESIDKCHRRGFYQERWLAQKG